MFVHPIFAITKTNMYVEGWKGLEEWEEQSDQKIRNMQIIRVIKPFLL